MDTLAERLAHALLVRGMSAADLARTKVASEAAVSMWLKGTTKSIRGENLLSICKTLRIEPVWLQTGKGAMSAPPAPKPSLREALSVLGEAIQSSPHRGSDALSGVFNSFLKDPESAAYRDMLEMLLIEKEVIDQTPKAHAA